MRLFFALEMPDAVRAELGSLIDRLRARARGVRWVDPRGMHLTVRFLGEVDPGRLPSIVTAGREAAGGFPALRLRTGGLGTFPERGRPRVAWVSLTDEEGRLAALHAALEAALEAAGVAREGRPFSPHLTLGRVREGSDPRQALSETPAPEPIGFEVRELILMESQLGPQGARYEDRGRFPLEGGT